jgi:hypothetical protein
MAHRRQQQFVEATQHVRTDGLGLVGAGHVEHHGFLDRDREVIGPEMHQPLDEGRRRLERARQSRIDGREVVVACAATQRLPCRLLVGVGGIAKLALPGLVAGQQRVGALLARPGGRGCLVAVELVEQPSARVGGRRLVRPRTETEAVQGNRAGGHGMSSWVKVWPVAAVRERIPAGRKGPAPA